MSQAFIFNDDPFDLIQIRMSGSVGRSGRNSREDAVLIQRLLNALPSASGGPSKPLKVDGLVGPQTINAISRFQTANRLYADGRIDAYKRSIKKLVPLVRSLGKLPDGLPNIGKPESRFAMALQPLGGANRPSRITTPPPAAPKFPLPGQLPKVRATPGGKTSSSIYATDTTTKWKFTGSGGAGFSVGYFGATAGDFMVESDDQPKVPYRLSYLGVTVGLSCTPAGFDVAFENMPSVGTRIYKALYSTLTYDKPGDFVGSCNFVTIEANSVVGGAGSAVCFIGNRMSSAWGALAGGQVGLPTVGISLCIGAVAGWK